MARKVEKLRPYRVDYFDILEMKKDRALVRSAVVRAVTAQAARDQVLHGIGEDAPPTPGVLGRIIIRSYRYYKNVSAKETFKPVEDLFTVNKAIEVMEVVEKFRAVLVTPAPTPVPCGTSEIAGANDYVDPDKPAGILEPARQIDLDAAAPIIHPAPTAVEIPNYTFPDYPVVPTQPAVFDDHVLTSTGEGSPTWNPPPANVPFPGPTPLWLKLIAFGSIAFIVVSIVLVILHSTH